MKTFYNLGPRLRGCASWSVPNLFAWKIQVFLRWDLSSDKGRKRYHQKRHLICVDILTHIDRHKCISRTSFFRDCKSVEDVQINIAKGNNFEFYWRTNIFDVAAHNNGESRVWQVSIPSFEFKETNRKISAQFESQASDIYVRRSIIY